jgi:pyruvate dehydrogenase (quinone)
MSDFRPKSGWYRRDIIRAAGAAGFAAIAPEAAAGALPSESESAVIPQPTTTANENQNTSDILVEALIEWGATHVFGIVGDGINPIIEALRRRQDRIRYIAVRHEEAAAFMASGIAKHSSRLGVCIGDYGPGRHSSDEWSL